MPDYQPHFFAGDTIPLVLSGTVTGGQLVTAAGAAAGAGSATFVGVADRDGVSGDQINAYTEGVHRLTAAATIAVGDTLKCAASGQVTPWVSGTDAANLIVGKALSAATSTNPVDVLFA